MIPSPTEDKCDYLPVNFLKSFTPSPIDAIMPKIGITTGSVADTADTH